ncbi:MAG: hypothetical protein QMD21_00970, partial [Candidatus Thermoplasmatota archaeon]|nr:hypothetical protein [Candidatus Thermoplasmatota archaeon]
ANWTKASAQRVFIWSTGTYAGKGGVIRVEGTTYRAIYFGFGFEGINGAAIRATIMNRTVTWLLGWKVSTVTLNLEKGWNFINLALDISHTAESLAQNITNCTQVARWNLSSEKFEIYVKGSGINNFAIEKGIGYLVYVTESTVATFCGSKITSLTLELKKGWNSIGWFKEAVTVGELALQIGNCTAVSYWDSSSGRFVVHPVGTLISDFELIKGKGYLVYVTQTTLWNG